MEMLTFTYKGKRRIAVELEPDQRLINCLHCYQVQPKQGFRSFKIPLMEGTERVDANPEQFPDLLEVLADKASHV